jgi:beta-galactosidase
MTQNPEILETRFGFRTAAYASRRVFPLGSSPITTGLDGKALSDWTGFATLREAYPDPKSLPRPTSDTTPTYGWPWGMQGVVSSVMVEKPHRSGWTPLLEGEFDLAYSPLLELGVGRGKITVCTLDLEDQHSVEPVARLLLDRVVSTASRLPRVVKSADYFLLGSDSGLMEEIGASPKLITSLPEKPCLVIVGQDAGVSEQQVRLFLERGGRALFLPRTKAFGPFSLSYQESFSGSLSSPGWPEASGLSASDLRRRSASPAWLLSGQDTAAGGQLGRWKVGKGVAIFFQMDPNLLNADKRTYFRFTRWRQTRALAQVLSNLGAQFLQDRRFFTAVEDSGGSIPLLQGWEVAVTEALSIPTDQSDPGPSSQAQQALNGQMGALNWQPFRAPGYVGVLDGKVGEAVFRKTIRVPEAWAGREAVLNLGSLDDYDITSFNGEVVGKTDRSTPSWWSHRRVYRIPARLLRVGDNVLCVRIFNVQGAGGFGGPPDQIALSKVGYRAPLNLYHHDYRSDFELGDNPFRYYRW